MQELTQNLWERYGSRTVLVIVSSFWFVFALHTNQHSLSFRFQFHNTKSALWKDGKFTVCPMWVVAIEQEYGNEKCVT